MIPTNLASQYFGGDDFTIFLGPQHFLFEECSKPLVVAQVTSVPEQVCYIPLHPTARPDPIDSSALHPAGLSMSPGPFSIL